MEKHLQEYRETGGVLIYDIKNIPNDELSKWNIETFDNVKEDPLPYNISKSSGLFYFGIDKQIKKNEEKKFYVAIPFPRNFNPEDKEFVTTLYGTSFFGGNKYTWTKKKQKSSHFVAPAPGFSTRKYVKDTQGKISNKRDAGIADNVNYYLDSFTNNGNIPAFDAELIDTLPSYFDTKKISISMDKKDGKTPKLTDWFASNHPVEIEFKLKENAKNPEEPKEPVYVSIGNMAIDTENTTGDELVWKADIKKAIEDYQKEHPDVELTGNIKIKLKHRIEKNEKFEGTVTINGDLPKGKNYENKLNANYDEWLYVQDTADTEEFYQKIHRKATEAEATINAQPGVPEINVDTYTDDGSGAVYNDPTVTPVFTKYAGYRYRLANNSNYRIVPGILETGNLLIKNDKELQGGLLAKNIFVSKELLNVAPVESIKLVYHDGRSDNFDSKHLSYDANGNIDLKVPTSKILKNAVIRFKHFNAKTNFSDDKYVLVNGMPNVIGTIPVKGKFRTDYGNPNYDRSAEDVGTLDVATLNMNLYANSFKINDDNTENKSGINTSSSSTVNSITVKNHCPNTGYDFEIENNSKASSGSSKMFIDLSQNVGDKAKSINPVIKGFMTKNIKISNIAATADIESISVYDWDQNSEDSPALKLSKDQLNISDDAIEIKKAILEKHNIKAVKYIEIKFSDYKNQDINNVQRLKIRLTGKSDWYDNLDAKATFSCDNVFLKPQTRKVTARIHIDRPKLSVRTNLYYYDNVKETAASQSGNDDGNRTRLAVPYDRDFRMEATVDNKSISTLDNPDISVYIPVNNGLHLQEAHTGFHTTKVVLTKELLESYGDIEDLSLYDVDKQLFPAKLTYDKSTNAFKTGEHTFTPNSNGDIVLTEKDLNDLGVKYLTKIFITGHDFALQGNGKIKVYGFSDAPFGNKSIFKADTANYLDSIREERYKVYAMDDSLLMISKMYFDATIVAGYKDSAGGDRFDKTSTSIEHVRRRHYRCSASFGDNSELDIGYKSLGSYMIDFRQYLNAGYNYPVDPTRNNYISQEQQDKNYVYTQSYNTAAYVRMKVTIPHDKFETYYLKVDPRAKDYYQKIEVVYKDGTIHEILPEDWQNNGLETATTGEKFFRINLMKGTPNYSGDETEYYRAQKDYPNPENPVEHIILHLRINQEESTVEDDKEIAKNPDYGTWFNARDQKTKYMFEITGRFYDEGKAEASVKSDITIGGDKLGNSRNRTGIKAKKRTDDSDVSSWSYWNKYRFYWKSGGYCYQDDDFYDSRHLASSARVWVSHDMNNVLKGVLSNPDKDEDLNRIYGDEYDYDVSFYRTPKGKNSDYLAGKNTDEWWDEDSFDWSSKISYGDQVELNDTLPLVHRDTTDEASEYKGFLTKNIRLSDKLYKYTKEVEIKTRHVTETGAVSAGRVIKLKPSDITDSNGGFHPINVRYKDLGESKSESNEIEMEHDEYVMSYKVILRDIPGGVNFAREYNKTSEMDFHDTRSTSDVKIGGNVYSIREIDDKVKYATNKMESRSYADKGDSANPKEITANLNSDKAAMMAFRIPFQAGVRIDSLDNNIVMDFHDKTQSNPNRDPNYASFGVKVWNRSDGSAADGSQNSAHIMNAKVTNNMHDKFRLKHIYIPGAFIDGDWFEVKNLVLKYNGKTYNYDKKELKKSPLLSKDSEGNYVFDVNGFIREHVNEFSTYKVNNTDESYVKEQITDFDIELSAVNPSRSDPKTVLDGGQYITFDKNNGYSFKYDGVYADRTKEEVEADEWTLNSVPTVFYPPNKYKYKHDKENNGLRQYVDATFATSDQNAQPYGGYAAGTNRYDSCLVGNTVADMVVNLTKTSETGGTTTRAYDNSNRDGESPRLAVDQNHLAPEDYIEYTLYMGADASSSIDLAKMFSDITVPEGMRIVGYRLGENTTSIPDEDISVKVGEGSTAKELKSNKIYSLAEDGSKTDYSRVSVECGKLPKDSFVKPGKYVKLILVAQLTNNAEFEGKDIKPFVWEAAAAHTHTYSQYRIYRQGGAGRNNSHNWGSDVWYTSDGDIAYYHGYKKYLNKFLNVPNEKTYISKVVTQDKFVNPGIAVSYTFDDAIRHYDKQPMTIKVSGPKAGAITNDTRHHLKDATFEVSFLSALNDKLYKNFDMTKKFEVNYPKNMDSSGHKDIKIEYCFTEDSKKDPSIGIYDKGTATEKWVDQKFVVTSKSELSTGKYLIADASKVRWTYYEIPDMGNDGNEVVFAPQGEPFEFKGLGRYRDIRTDAEKQGRLKTYADRYDMKIYASKDFYHSHEEDIDNSIAGKKGTTTKKYSSDVHLHAKASTNKLIARERPVPTLHTQIFETKDEAEAEYSSTKSQKLGYRPNETVWFKTTLKNKILTPETADSQMQGVLREPVIYDKIPEYITTEGLSSKDITIKWYDEKGNEKPVPSYSIKSSKDLSAPDYGGAMTVTEKANDGESLGEGHAYQDFKLGGLGSNTKSKDTKYNLYKIEFEKGTRLEIGERIELSYSAKIREKDLPTVLTRKADGSFYMDYYPKTSEYYQYDSRWINSYQRYAYGYPHFSSAKERILSHGPYSETFRRRLDNENRLMDMHFLQHDVGVSGSINPNIDMFEYLKDAISYMPGSPDESSDRGGSNGWLKDLDMSPTHSYQQDPEYNPVFEAGKTVMDKKPSADKVQYLKAGHNRDYYQLLMRLRNKLRDWDDEKEEGIVWAQARTHLKMSWLASSSQIIPKEGDIQKDKEYLAQGMFDGKYNKEFATHKNHTPWKNDSLKYDRFKYYYDDTLPKIEYNQKFTTRIGAYNYGDWDVSGGVKFTYVMPRGIEPVVEDGKVSGVTAKVLSGGNSLSPTYAPIDADAIEVKILQRPGDERGYKSPMRIQDPLLVQPHLNRTTDDYSKKPEYYDNDDKKNSSWVLEIKVKRPVKKWVDRGSGKEYQILADIPSRVYRTNADEYWYDEVYARPIEPESQENLYYQIYDEKVTEKGHTKVITKNTRMSTQVGGMDYLYSCTDYGLGYINGAPSMPYIDGYNISNREETLKDGEGTVDQGTEDNIRSGHRDTYAVTGTRARMRKPFVRTWATVGKGSNVNSGDPYDYYVNGEFDSSSLNVHLENNYYWYESSPASTGYSYNNIDRFYHSYSTDGGNKGTLFYPVVNDLLPPGVVPKADDGTLFTKDNNKNDKKTLAWRLRDKEGNILDSEKPLYKAKVIYVPTVTSSGEKEGRYRVVFLPSDNTNPETRINNLETKVFQFDFYTKNYPDDSTKDGKTNEDLMKQYQSNRIYVGSQLDNFKLVTDKDISGNPYYVGAKCRRIQTGTYDYLYSDYRKDAVKVNFPKNNVKGVLPDHNINLPILGTSYGIINDSNRGGNLRYKETDEFELEDYTNVRNSVKIKDVDWNLLSGNDDKDYVSEGTSSDNRIRVKKASVKNETYVSHIKPDINGSEVQNLGKRGQYDKEIYYPDKDSLMEYGDKLYYTVKMSGNAGDKEYEYMGDINHAKLNISFHLPKIASYRQKYYKDDLYIISRNSAGDLTMLQGLDEIEAAGYKVEKVKEKIKDDGKEVVTFEIVTPGEGTSYQDAIDGKRIPGYFGHDETLYFGLRTDIDNGEDPDTILTGDNFWDDKYSAETYASYHDAKGNFLNKRFHEGGFDDLDANGMRYTRYKKHVKDKKPSGEENFADDFDLDGEYDESFATDISATVKLRKPHSKVRVDTDIRRILLTNPDADVQVAEDPTIKGARHVKLHLDQAQNDGARVGEFAIDYRIPFRGTDYSTAEEAQPEDGNIDTYVYNIRTGVWEIPESAGDTAYREALANNLKVHVYALCAPEGKTPSEAGATYQNISTDWRSDSSWKRITPKEGVGLRDNKVINTEEYGNRIYQIRYVITASEDDVEKARTYGVPKGFRLDVDANDKTPEKEEMNDIDPSHLNVNAMPKNVEDNSAYVEIVTINNHPYRKHVNSFVNGMARYCDKKSGATGSRSRAGHYISYEIPVIFVDMSSKYFKLKKEGGKKKFKWDSEMVVDPSLSTMIKYRAEFHNLSDAEIKANNIDQDEDNCSMPQVSIAMPYLDKLDRSKSKDSDNKYGYRNFKYLDYASEYSGSKLDDTYSGDKPIYNNEVYWTWHVEDKEGNFVDTTGRFKDKDVRMYDKYIDLTNLQRTIVTWDFDGYLKPGEHIIVECMVPIESKDHGMVNPELLNSKLYGFKDGSFRIHIPEESTITEKWALEYDTRDINVNDKTTSEATLTKQLGGLSFASQRSLVRNKTSHSEYGSGLNEIGNGASVPSLVPEGSDYSFSADSINTDVADSLNPYERPIIYDELPYEGDHNTNGEPRNSKWSGIIKPDSVKVYSYYTEETGGISKLKHKELVDGKDVTIWVGPIKKEGGKLKLLSRDVLPKPEETTNQTNNGNIWFENLYGTSAQAMAKKAS